MTENFILIVSSEENIKFYNVPPVRGDDIMDKTAKSILEKLIDIFDYILARDECHYDDIERDLGVSRKTVYVYLNFLEEVCGVAIERQ
jgi:predicted transcriptional regulator